MNKLTIAFGLIAFFTACGDDDGGGGSSGGAGGLATGGKNSGGAAGKGSGGTAGQGSGGKHSGGAGMAGGGTEGGTNGGALGAGAGGTAGEGGGGDDAGGFGGVAGQGGAGGLGPRVFGSPACIQIAAVAPCDSSVVAYAFNAKTKKCELVAEGLCTGSDNHFASESECLSTCKVEPHCPEGVWAGGGLPCPNYQADSSCWVEYPLYEFTSCNCHTTWVCAL